MMFRPGKPLCARFKSLKINVKKPLTKSLTVITVMIYLFFTIIRIKENFIIFTSSIFVLIN